MPVDLLALGAAFLSGLLGGVHCLAMCGGIATGLALGAGEGRHAALRSALWTHAGRISGYVLAGALVGGLGAGLLAVVRIDGLALALRAAVGVVLILVGLRLLDGRGRFNLFAAPAQMLWQRLRPLQQRLLPARRADQQFALGALWGWLPCGLSTSLLAVAWLQAEAAHGALTMLAFGLGTLPIMLPLSWSGARAARWLRAPSTRRAAGVIVLSAGALTLAAPWAMQAPAMHALLSALGCRVLS